MKNLPCIEVLPENPDTLSEVREANKRSGAEWTVRAMVQCDYITFTASLFLDSYELGMQYANEIQRRCNSHQALVSALEGYITAIKKLSRIKDGKTLFEGSPTKDAECHAAWVGLNDALKQARAALAAAKL